MTLDKMKQEGHGTLAFEMASQYRGLLIDQFTCADEVCCAIDAVGGNRLGYCNDRHTLLEMVLNINLHYPSQTLLQYC